MHTPVNGSAVSDLVLSISDINCAANVIQGHIRNKDEVYYPVCKHIEYRVGQKTDYFQMFVTRDSLLYDDTER